MSLAIKMENICKIYNNGFLANDNINFELETGEIHAIAGENGAGKSTLMKILYGAETPTTGKIYINETEVKINSPAQSMKHGIGMVFQHFMLVDELTVFENIFLGVEKTKLNVLLKQQMKQELRKYANEYNIHVDFEAKCGTLSVSQKQKVEILKVLSKHSKIIIFDEPTAVLTAPEVNELFTQLRLLRDAGHTIVIITHKLAEIKSLCNRVTILKRGQSVGTYDVDKMDVEMISRLMVGFDVQLFPNEKGAVNSDKPLLTLENVVAINGDKSPVSFTVHEGEIVCLMGVEGSGQEKVIEYITGIDKQFKGEIYLKDQLLNKLSVLAIRNKGLSYIPANRMDLGVNLETTVLENLAALRILATPTKKLGFFNKKRLINLSNHEIDDYRVKTSSINQQIDLLSGGNIQKIVAAREIEVAPQLLVAEHPTRGVDIGTMELIFTKIRTLKAAGSGILLVSTDWNEMRALADRLLVFFNGEITAEFTDLGAIEEYEIGYYMLGIKKMERANA